MWPESPGIPPQVCAWLRVTFGSAVSCRSVLVAATSRSSAGRADQSRATTPTTCGPAIEVPLRLTYCVSLPLYDDRLLTPGATTFGLRRFEPSTVTGPRLLNPVTCLLLLMAPVANDAS